MATTLAIGAAGLLATTSAQAADTVDADVGGAVAGIAVGNRTTSYTLFGLNAPKDTVRFNYATPEKTLGKNGGNLRGNALYQTVGPVSVNAALVTIKGERAGNPFAEGFTSLTGVSIKGTTIQALQTKCRWDNSSAPSGSTVVTNINGTKSAPARNTVKTIPGLGTLTFNEQHVNTRFVGFTTTNEPIYQEVIYVFGAHLHLSSSAADQYQTTDIILGFTSCDPVVIPNLSGLKLSQSFT